MRMRRREFLRSTAAAAAIAGMLASGGSAAAAEAAPYPCNPSLSAVAGKVKIPDGPGWGVRINPTWLEKATFQKSERPAR